MRHLGDRLDALVDDLLAPRQRDRLVAHAAHCGRCGEELALHRRVKERLERAAAPELPGGLVDRLRSIATEDMPPRATWTLNADCQRTPIRICQVRAAATNPVAHRPCSTPIADR